MTTKKSFFNDDKRYSDDALQLDQEVVRAVTPLFDKYHKLGYSFREIYYIITQAVNGVQLTRLL